MNTEEKIDKYLNESVVSKTLEITKASDIIGSILMSILKLIDNISGEGYLKDQEFKNGMIKEINKMMAKKSDVEKSILKSVIKKLK